MAIYGPTDAKGGYGPHQLKPCMCSDEQGRTSECFPGVSNMNLGMYPWIEQHGDRQTDRRTDHWRLAA